MVPSVLGCLSAECIEWPAQSLEAPQSENAEARPSTWQLGTLGTPGALAPYENPIHRPAAATMNQRRST